MSKGRPKPPRPRNNSPIQTQQKQVTVQAASFKGPLPPPSLLQEYDRIYPGAARVLIERAEKEADHRHEQENKALKANIDAQERHQQIVSAQSAAVFRSDALGQILGFIVCVACGIGAFYLGLNGHDLGAASLAAIPTAAIVQAFRVAGIRKESVKK